jgi:hypothetical protein
MGGSGAKKYLAALRRWTITQNKRIPDNSIAIRK